MRQLSLLASEIDTGATFSHCRRYRYTLWRIWDPDLPLVNWIMLNPSTADEIQNDPTVERCERRARAWEYGGILVTNIFAFRATDPADMKAQADPVGLENNSSIVASARRAGLVICAWGNHGSHMGRSEKVRRLLRTFEIPVHHLRISETGEPGHPLYIGYDVQPTRWEL